MKWEEKTFLGHAFWVEFVTDQSNDEPNYFVIFILYYFQLIDVRDITRPRVARLSSRKVRLTK